MNSDCQLPIADLKKRFAAASNWQSAIANRKCLETAKRGQSAHCPDRLLRKAADLSVNFFGSNASASILP